MILRIIPKIKSLTPLKNSLAIGFAFLTLSACTTETKTLRTKPYVVSTTTLMKDLVDSLWGDQVESESLMGPGIDPHLYQPTAKDLSKLEEADYIVAHGLHLEGRMVEALAALSKKKKVLITGDKLDHAQLLHANASIDPHIWFSPTLWLKTAQILAENPPHPRILSHSLENFAKELNLLAEKYEKEFQKIPREHRVLITSHDAFQYMGRAFDFEVQGIQGVSTDSEVGVKRIEDLISLIKKRKIKAIYSETSVSPRSIEKLISESGAKLGGLLYSDALGGPGSGAETYLKMLEHNLKIIVEGLK